ncbi:Thaumatin, conserved site [Sesbania bispinosa]|nr:Thaumatin, conserved site [Sesbania bispinosa]
MAVTKSLSIFLFIAMSCIAAAQAARFSVTNRCNYTVWAAAVPGGGIRLDSGESWGLNVTNGTSGGRIWGRTNCSFDSTGRGKCETGDCGGVLECESYGTPPNTVVEFALNKYNELDFFDISVVDGFNIPLQFIPSNNACSSVNCTGNINEECPGQLKVAGGCQNPCTAFNTTQYCCNDGSARCGPTTYSRFFKDRCPDAYSYPNDDATSTFTCMGGTNYTVVFCP